MSDEPLDAQNSEEHGEDVDPGQPIAELAGFEYDVSRSLLGRIRRSIGRRTAAAQVTSFAMDMPSLIFKEFWQIVIQLFDAKKPPRKDVRR